MNCMLNPTVLQQYSKPGDSASQIYLGLGVTVVFVVLMLLGTLIGYKTRRFETAPLEVDCGDTSIPKMKLGLSVLDSTGSLKKGPARTAGQPDSMYYTADREGGVQNGEIASRIQVKMVPPAPATTEAEKKNN